MTAYVIAPLAAKYFTRNTIVGLYSGENTEYLNSWVFDIKFTKCNHLSCYIKIINELNNSVQNHTRVIVKNHIYDMSHMRNSHIFYYKIMVSHARTVCTAFRIVISVVLVGNSLINLLLLIYFKRQIIVLVNTCHNDKIYRLALIL